MANCPEPVRGFGRDSPLNRERERTDGSASPLDGVGQGFVVVLLELDQQYRIGVRAVKVGLGECGGSNQIEKGAVQELNG